MTPEARAARERKQKIFVVVGGLFLLALLAIQLPKLLGGSESAASATTTGTTATTPSGTAAPPADDSVSISVSLADTDRPLDVGPGQLRSFSSFSRKDPFVQQIVSPPESGASEGGGGGVPAGGETADQPAKAPSQGFTVGGKTTAASVTVVSVNGVRQTLSPGNTFPAADPVFVLVAEQPGTKSVLIGVAGGEYANGANATRLRLGKPLVLVNTTTGARYRLVLVAVGNGEAAADGPAGENGNGAAGDTTP